MQSEDKVDSLQRDDVAEIMNIVQGGTLRILIP